jgi:hypothetical protein
MTGILSLVVDVGDYFLFENIARNNLILYNTIVVLMILSILNILTTYPQFLYFQTKSVYHSKIGWPKLCTLFMGTSNKAHKKCNFRGVVVKCSLPTY